MTQRIRVVPAPGRAVPDPDSGDLLPTEGREVNDSTWWRRRIAVGDVTKQAAETTTKAAKSPKPEEAQ